MKTNEKTGDFNTVNTLNDFNDLNNKNKNIKDIKNTNSFETDMSYKDKSDNESKDETFEESEAMPIETDETSKQDTSSAAEVTDMFVEEELSKAQADLNALNDKYLRLVADFENYKRRVARDREELRKYANEAIMSDLLSIIDHLEMAVKHSHGEVNDNVVQGVELTLKEFEKLLDKNSVKPINAMGEQFDPTVHHAMAQIVSSDAEENSVIEEFRKGYMLNEKVIRPSLVAVAKPPEKAEES